MKPRRVDEIIAKGWMRRSALPHLDDNYHSTPHLAVCYFSSTADRRARVDHIMFIMRHSMRSGIVCILLFLHSASPFFFSMDRYLLQDQE